MFGWESFKAITEWLKPLAKRGDTYLLAISLVTLGVAASFQQRYQYFPAAIIAVIAIGIITFAGAIAYTRLKPFAHAWRLYAAPSTVWLAYFLYIGVSWPFWAAPIGGYVATVVMTQRSSQHGDAEKK